MDTLERVALAYLVIGMLIGAGVAIGVFAAMVERWWK